MCPLAASAFEWVQAIAGAVAALAALGTLFFLYLTVRGAQALRKAENRAHLLDLAADYAEAGRESMRGEYGAARIATERFRAALDSTGKPLPASRRLLEVEWGQPSMGAEAEQRYAAADRALEEALDELSAWLRD
jgi:hypothetical protein